MEDAADENDDHSEEEYQKEDNQSPRVTWRDVTHPLHRRTARFTRVCAIIDTAAVAVFLHSHQYSLFDT